MFHACDLNFALSQLLHKQCMRCSSHYAPLAEKVHVRQPLSKAFGCLRCRPGPSLLANPYWFSLHTTDMLFSLMLLFFFLIFFFQFIVFVAHLLLKLLGDYINHARREFIDMQEYATAGAFYSVIKRLACCIHLNTQLRKIRNIL